MDYSTTEFSHHRKGTESNYLGLQSFSDLVCGKKVVVHVDNTTALSYIHKQGATHSFSLYEKVRDLLLWVEANQVTLVTRFIQGRMNVIVDELRRLKRSFQPNGP